MNWLGSQIVSAIDRSTARETEAGDLLDEFLPEEFCFVRAKEADLKYNPAPHYDRLEARWLNFLAVEPGSYLIHGFTEGWPFNIYRDLSCQRHVALLRSLKAGARESLSAGARALGVTWHWSTNHPFSPVSEYRLG